MGVGAVLGIAGGVLGAAGSIGGSLLSKPPSPNPRKDQLLTYGARFDPVQAAASADVMQQLGYADPATMRQQGPLGQLLSAMLNSPNTLKAHQEELRFLADIYNRLDAGEPVDVASLTNNLHGQKLNTPLQKKLQEFSAQLGMSWEQMITDEKQFRAQIEPKIQQAQQTANQTFASRQNINKQLAEMGLAANDFGAMRDLAKTSLTSDINRVADLGRSDLTRAANFGNYNPGRAISDLELQRSNNLRDVDLLALDRASALISGQAQQASYLQGLLSPATAAAQTTAAQRTAAAAGGVQAIGTAQANTPRMSGVGVGLSALGAGGSAALNNYFGMQALNSLKPAYNSATNMPADYYSNIANQAAGWGG